MAPVAVSTDGPQRPLGAPRSFHEIPTVDFADIAGNHAKFVEDLRYALMDVGFMYLKNAPGFDSATLATLFDRAHALMDLPEDEKDKLASFDVFSRQFRGLRRQTEKDIVEMYSWGFERPSYELDDESVPLWKRIMNGPNVWPDEAQVPGLKAVFSAHWTNCFEVLKVLVHEIAKMLEIPEKFFDKWMFEFDDKTGTEPYLYANINHYVPPSEVPPVKLERLRAGAYVNGLGAHRDTSTFLTLLAIDDDGLEVLNHDGEWIKVPPKEGCIACNIGTPLSELTNGALVATTHRVNTLSCTRRRISIPYFLMPAFDLPLEHAPNPALRPKVHNDGGLDKLYSSPLKDRAQRWIRHHAYFYPDQFRHYYGEELRKHYAELR